MARPQRDQDAEKDDAGAGFGEEGERREERSDSLMEFPGTGQTGAGHYRNPSRNTMLEREELLDATVAAQGCHQGDQRHVFQTFTPSVSFATSDAQTTGVFLCCPKTLLLASGQLI